MKMRVLYYTNKAKLKNIAGIITDNYATEKVNCMDKIPPAYSCDKERLVVMIVFRSSAESRTTRRRTSPSGWTRSPLIFSK